MNLPIDAGKLEQLLKEDSALRGKLETSLARLAVKPGAEIDEELLRKAMAEAGLAGERQAMAALDDDALESVAGGRILFNEDGVNRNSWFVSLLSMLMAQDANRTDENQAQGPLPREITIDGKTYRILRVGVPGSYRYVMEELA